MNVFKLPDLGEGLTEADVVEWRVAVGDVVAVDEVVAVVETAKATVELPCPYAGRVAALHGDAGSSVTVGAPFISIDPQTPAAQQTTPDGASADQEHRAAGSGNVLIGYGTKDAPSPRRRRTRRTPAPTRLSGAASPSQRALDQGAPDQTDALPTTPPGAIADHMLGQSVRVISPLVRRVAADRGIDLRLVSPTGPGHIILRRDVDAAQSAPHDHQGCSTSTSPQGVGSVERAGDTRIPLTGVRKTIAEKLTTSRHDIPDATTWVDVDATELLAVKKALAAAAPSGGISLLALLARICVAGLRRYPELNARVDLGRGEIIQLGEVHLSIAADSPRGLVVPVVRHAGRMTTTELATALRQLTDKARTGTLAPADLTGGTFTLNNYGVFGVDGSTPILNHPEAAMLGVGRIIDRPWVHKGQLTVRAVTQLSFTFDHRVCDGGSAGGFLRYVADCVEQPAMLLADI